MVDFPKNPKVGFPPPLDLGTSQRRTPEISVGLPKPPTTGKIPSDALQQYYEHDNQMAEAADIRRPGPERIRDEEQGAQKEMPARTSAREVPREVQERIRVLQEMGRKSVRVEGRGEAFMEFHRDQILLAEAEILAGIPRKKKKKRKRWRDYQKWLHEKSAYILDSVGSLFRRKP